MIQITEPDRTKPCWVLFDGGWVQKEMRNGYKMRGVRLRLAEFAWDGEAWRRTERPVLYINSLYKAIKLADWIGKLPNQGRSRQPKLLTPQEADQLQAVLDYRSLGWSIRRIAQRLDLSRSKVHRWIQSQSVPG